MRRYCVRYFFGDVTARSWLRLPRPVFGQADSSIGKCRHRRVTATAGRLASCVQLRVADLQLVAGPHTDDVSQADAPAAVPRPHHTVVFVVLKERLGGGFTLGVRPDGMERTTFQRWDRGIGHRRGSFHTVRRAPSRFFWTGNALLTHSFRRFPPMGSDRS
jgi:hypothetical protein